MAVLSAAADEPETQTAVESPTGKEAPPVTEAATGAVTPATLLKEADAMMARGDREGARVIYARIAAEHPGTVEAQQATRSVWMIDSLQPVRPAQPTPAAPPGDGLVLEKPAYFTLEPYSARTGERLRINSWEKLDFGVTAFLYGLSTGVTIGLAFDADEASGPGQLSTAMAGAALAYTGLAVGYLAFGKPDRGDLPLVLAISSYVPATVGLSALATEWDDQSAVVTAALAGVVAVPVAWMAAAKTNLDPGDTQLVRDAGFWGGGISFLMAASLTENTSAWGLAGLGGLYGGLALGLVAASYTDVTLERVRVSTWGGYGGAIIGGLLGLSSDDDEGVLVGISMGATAGLVFSLVLTSAVDVIPDDVQIVADGGASISFLRPAVVPSIERDGRPTVAPGIDLVGGTF